MTETTTLTRWDTLERWSATVFLAAGALFFVAGVIGALGAYTPVNTEGEFMLFVEGIGGFGGVVLSYIGLLSLYPRLHGDRLGSPVRPHLSLKSSANQLAPEH